MDRFTTHHNTVTAARSLAALCSLVLIVASACGDDDSTPDASKGGGESDASSSKGGGESDASSSKDSGRSAADSAADSGAASGMCADGCECNDGEVCDYECGAKCSVSCLGGQCTAACAEGGCTLDADIGGDATYSCAGGGCHVDCDVGSVCALDCSGGGCDVTCDQGSVCAVTCAEDSDPCTVTCENGGRGFCQSGNCSAQNCDTACMPDATYKPAIDPADFSTVIDNPLLPWPIGAVFHSEGGGEVITLTVTDQAKKINGVDVVVVHDEVRSTDGELIEDTLDYYAQDSKGNVWYFGEDTAEYVKGKVSTTAGSWLYGKDGALPGIAMQAMPKKGDVYRQEYYACQAEDMGEVLELGVSVKGPTGSYKGCVNTRDYTPLEPSANEQKTYCPGVGVVQVVDLAAGGQVVEELTSVKLP